MQATGKNEPERVDATRLADFQRCAKFFDYRHNQGYQAKGDKIDLVFGSLFGEALEAFEKALFAGKSPNDAQQAALTGLLDGARNPDGSNRFGEFLDTWRCTGVKPYKNQNGNAAKCPYSHKGRYFPTEPPELCSCGSPIEKHNLWMPVKAGKDIDKLVELLVGYTDGAATRHLIPLKLDDKPLIEHYWETELDHPALIAPVLLCGNIDAVKGYGTENLIVDYKTTGKSINDMYWQGFTPNVQIDLYNMAAKKALPTLDIKGVALEAFSTSGGGGFHIFRATDEQKAEMFKDTLFWVSMLQNCRKTDVWPRNRTSCFLCPFQQVCSRPPEARQAILDTKFERARWNPLLRRLEPIGISSPSMSIPTTTNEPKPTSPAPSSSMLSTPASIPSTTANLSEAAAMETSHGQ